MTRWVLIFCDLFMHFWKIVQAQSLVPSICFKELFKVRNKNGAKITAPDCCNQDISESLFTLIFLCLRIYSHINILLTYRGHEPLQFLQSTKNVMQIRADIFLSTSSAVLSSQCVLLAKHRWNTMSSFLLNYIRAMVS